MYAAASKITNKICKKMLVASNHTLEGIETLHRELHAVEVGPVEVCTGWSGQL